MKKFISIASTVLLTSFASHTYAACSSNSCTGKVKKIYMPDAEFIYINLDSDTQPLVNAYVPGVAGCNPISRSSKFNGYIRLFGTHRNYDEIYSSLLAAKHNDTNIKLRIKSGGSKCEVSYAVDQ